MLKASIVLLSLVIATLLMVIVLGWPRKPKPIIVSVPVKEPCDTGVNITTTAGTSPLVAKIDRRAVPPGWEGRFYMHELPPERPCPVKEKWNQTPMVFHSEFGFELIIMVPFAYYLHLNCYELNITTTPGASPLYSFAENVTEIDIKRQSLPEDFSCCPLQTVHMPKMSHDRWAPPPYKTLYQNWFFTYDKPILVISNKYQREWGKNPINFIPVDVLLRMVDLLLPHYTIVYSRPGNDHIAPDGSRHIDLDEKDALREKGVLLMDDLYTSCQQAWPVSYPYNQFQMWVFANSERFIAVQGGNSVLASYMAGPTGLVHVYIVQGKELQGETIGTWYSQFSGAYVRMYRAMSDLEASMSAFIPPPRSFVRKPPPPVAPSTNGD
eukprot:TRINITY_DN2524_c1_g1_i2.p1 TRINITY_DN2524_c1_g1~~TRINITY_DN2524_c1_g1_i2.p1  ORF type:complete len:381 (+),score=105.80 TRINITY_DN2524_c1_g1_i2:1098-2240(+)